MGNHLAGRVAVVPGSGQGIGRAIAKALAAEGAKVVTNNRKPSDGKNLTGQLDEAKLARLTPEQREWTLKEYASYSGDAETTAEEIRKAGGEAVACFADIADFDAAGRIIETAIEHYGTVDILVNVAGAFGFSPIEKMTRELWDRVNNCKPGGYFNTIRHAAPYMLEKGWGRIINCSSPAFVSSGGLRHSQYTAANAAVVGFSRAISDELSSRGVTCNAFCPAAKTRASVDMEMFDKTVTDKGDGVSIKGEDNLLGGYNVSPDPEVFAQFISYLASDEGASITGQTFLLLGNFIGRYSEPTIIGAMTREGAGCWTFEDVERDAHKLFEPLPPMGK